jgi:protein-tyrosine-phosphatase
MKKVLFVCLGNICRSPIAHGIFEQMVAAAGLGHQIVVDSAGTHHTILVNYLINVLVSFVSNAG